LAGGKLYTYDAGTSTPRDTYTDSAEADANLNPVILDNKGEAHIWFAGRYKVILKDSHDVLQWEADNVYDVGALLQSQLAHSSDPTYGDGLIAFKQPLADAAARTVRDKMQEAVSIADFGAVGDGTTDDTAVLQNAINAANGKALLIDRPLRITAPASITNTSDSHLKFEGGGKLVTDFASPKAVRIMSQCF
jgi:hypothetical protein